MSHEGRREETKRERVRRRQKRGENNKIKKIDERIKMSDCREGRRN